MEKKFLYIGIALIIVFFAVTFTAVPAVLGIGFSHLSFAVASGHDAYAVAPSNSSYISTVEYNSSANLSFYVANATAFNSLLPYVSLNESLVNESLALEGKGMLEIAKSSQLGEFPPSNAVAGSGTILYANYNSLLAISEPYYLLFENGGQETANVILLITHVRNPFSNAVGFASIGVGVLVLLLFGIGFVIYGIFKKPKTQEGATAAGAASREDVDAIYNKIEKKERK